MNKHGRQLVEKDIEVSPVSYLGTNAFVIALLVEKGHLQVRRNFKGIPCFMKTDMDEFLRRVRARSAGLGRTDGSAPS